MPPYVTLFYELDLYAPLFGCSVTGGNPKGQAGGGRVQTGMDEIFDDFGTTVSAAPRSLLAVSRAIWNCSYSRIY